MLRNPRAEYQRQRSWASLKFKSCREEEIEVNTCQRAGPYYLVNVKSKTACFDLKLKPSSDLLIEPRKKFKIRYSKVDGNGFPVKVAVLAEIK